MVHVDQYEFGRIVINGTPYTRDVKIAGGQIKPDWWRQEGHFCQLVDLPELGEKWDAVVIGTGKYGRMIVAPEVLQELKNLKIPYFIDITEKAVEEFNRLTIQKPNRVLGAFHLTC